MHAALGSCPLLRPSTMSFPFSAIRLDSTNPSLSRSAPFCFACILQTSRVMLCTLEIHLTACYNRRPLRFIERSDRNLIASGIIRRQQNRQTGSLEVTSRFVWFEFFRTIATISRCIRRCKSVVCAFLYRRSSLNVRRIPFAAEEMRRSQHDCMKRSL